MGSLVPPEGSTGPAAVRPAGHVVRRVVGVREIVRDWLREVRPDPAVFASRHRVLRILLWLHVLLIAAVAGLEGAGWLRQVLGGATGAAPAAVGLPRWHLWLLWGFVAGAFVCAVLGERPGSTRGRGVAVSLGLTLSAAALAHAAPGLPDLHLHFMVVLALVGLYQDWVPLALAVVLVSADHALVGVLAPTMVYSGPQARAEPAAYAALPAALLVAMCVVQLAYWRFAQQASAALRGAAERSSRLALVARYTDNGVAITDPAGVITWVNDAFTRITGHPAGSALGRTRLSLFHGSAEHLRSLAEVFAGATGGVDVEFATFGAQGAPCWLSVEVRPVLESGLVRHLVWVERDVTAPRRAQERLHATSRRAENLAAELSAEKALLSEMISTIPHFVYWKDPQRRYRGANPAYLALRELGAERELATRTEQEIPGGDPLEALRELEEGVLATGEPALDRQLGVSGGGGRHRLLLVSVLPNRTPGGVIDGVIGVGADITHVSELERQVAQASRLEAIGGLAAGIAHEINTPVQFIADNTRFVADVLKEVCPAIVQATELAGALCAQVGEPSGAPGEVEGTPAGVADQLRRTLSALDVKELSGEVHGALQESLEGLDRVTGIVRAMKDFSHPGDERRDTDLNRAVESTAQVCRNEWKYVATLDLDLDPELGPVRCYEGELKQVILNMIVNAAQAVAERREREGEAAPGRIGVRTQRDGEGVRIVISDTGTGMDEATRERIFDPFFTTKAVGKGTGQGLSIAHNCIVGRHGGSIAVESVPAVGTTFTIRLPRGGAGAG